MSDDLSTALARAVAAARARRGLSVAGLAEASGVSRAMIAKVERAEVQPTAALLARLTGPLGLTLSELIAQAETVASPVARLADQPTWTDPETGYTRRAVSPPSTSPLELVEVTLPPGVEIGYPAEAFWFVDRQVLVLAGDLRVTDGSEMHELGAGDCLRFDSPRDTAFANPGEAPNRYLVALAKRP